MRLSMLSRDPVISAIQTGNLNEVKAFFSKRCQQKGLPFNPFDFPIVFGGEYVGQRPLYIAAVAEQMAIMDYLIEQGASLNLQNEKIDDESRTHLSPILGALKARKFNAVRYLVEVQQLDPNIVVVTYGCPKRQYLHPRLLTPLEFALGIKDVDAVGLLLSLGADPTKKLALSDALRTDLERLKPRSLVSNYRVPDNEETVLHHLVKDIDLVSLKTLDDTAIRLDPNRPINFKIVDSNKNTLLHISESPAITEFLLTKKLDVNALNEAGDAPIHPALLHDEQILEKLLEHHADPNLKAQTAELSKFESEQCTPLFIASLYGYPAKVRALLGAGADIKTTQDASGNSALYAACVYANEDYRYETGYLAVAEILLDAGIDPNTTNDLGETPLTCAMMAGSLKLIQVLLDHGANPNMPGKDNSLKVVLLSKDLSHDDLKRSCLLELLIQKGANVKAITREELIEVSSKRPITYKTLMCSLNLHQACDRKNIEQVIGLIKGHPFLRKMKLQNGDSLAHFTLRLAKENSSDRKLIEFMKLLLVDEELKRIQNVDKLTPLELAKQYRLSAYIELLASPLDRQLNQVLFNDNIVVELIGNFLSGKIMFHKDTIVSAEFLPLIGEVQGASVQQNLSMLVRTKLLQKFENLHSFQSSNPHLLEDTTVKKLYQLVDESQQNYEERQKTGLIPARVLSDAESYTVLATLYNLEQVVANQLKLQLSEQDQCSAWQIGSKGEQGAKSQATNPCRLLGKRVKEPGEEPSAKERKEKDESKLTG